GQVLDLAMLRALAQPVEILDPQVEGAPAAAGQHPGEDRGAEVAQVQVAAGGGSVAAGAVGRGVSEHAERSGSRDGPAGRRRPVRRGPGGPRGRGRTRDERRGDRKSTRLNSSHVSISYAVFCLKKKNEVLATG